MSRVTMSCLSVRSERLFSTADNIVNKKRAAPDPDPVDRLVFLANKLKELIYWHYRRYSCCRLLFSWQVIFALWSSNSVFFFAHCIANFLVMHSGISYWLVDSLFQRLWFHISSNLIFLKSDRPTLHNALSALKSAIN